MNTRSMLFAAIVTLSATAFANGQTPAVNLPNGLTTAFTFETSGASPGALMSLFGQNLATTQAGASTPVLPTTLAGAQIVWNGLTDANSNYTLGTGEATPLLFASPLQLNFQAPIFDYTNPKQSFVIYVDHGNGNTDTAGPFYIEVQYMNPNLYSDPVTGYAINTNCYSGAIMPTSTPIGVVNNAIALTAYGTGFPALPGAVAGHPTPVPPENNPLQNALPMDDLSMVVQYTSDVTKVPVQLSPSVISYIGAVQNFVGLYQINLVLPPTIQSGRIDIGLADSYGDAVELAPIVFTTNN